MHLIHGKLDGSHGDDFHYIGVKILKKRSTANLFLGALRWGW